MASAIALAAVVAGLLRFGAALTLAVTLAVPAAEPWAAPLLHPVIREVVTVPTGARMLSADRYRPRHAAGALLLVHGLSRAGRRQPELERVARLLAEHELVVVVPQFEGLAAFRLAGTEVDDIRAALRYTMDRHPRAGLVGFSFGAGPALLAAADVPGLAVVGSFGGYADLTDVIRFVTTGVHSFGGRRYVRPQQAADRWKLLMVLAGFVREARDRQRLAALADDRLGGRPHDPSALARALGTEGRAVLAVVLNDRDDAVDALLTRLPAAAREALERLSPLRAVRRLSAPVLIAHGTADDTIPFTESLRLSAAAGGRARLTLFQAFDHTGLGYRPVRERIREGRKLIGLVDELLRAYAPGGHG